MDILSLKDLFNIVYPIRDTCITTILQNLGCKYFNTLGPHWPVDMNYDTVYLKSIPQKYLVLRVYNSWYQLYTLC